MVEDRLRPFPPYILIDHYLMDEQINAAHWFTTAAAPHSSPRKNWVRCALYGDINPHDSLES